MRWIFGANEISASAAAAQPGPCAVPTAALRRPEPSGGTRNSNYYYEVRHYRCTMWDGRILTDQG